jgi:hypothetical protein
MILMSSRTGAPGIVTFPAQRSALALVQARDAEEQNPPHGPLR